MPRKIEKLDNQIFGTYQVIEQDIELSQQKNRIYWKCKCINCGNLLSVRADNLKRLPKNCPNCRYPNLIGQSFGRLSVISKGKTDSNGHIFWVCKCSCGNVKEIAGSNLIQGYTSSCGCLHSQMTSELLLKDITGQKFGRLTAISRTSKIGEKAKWLCKCDCGSSVEVQSNNLINGHTQSCGCIRSIGELKIREILLANQILFKTEYVFSDFPNRRFDFAIYNENINDISYLIEFDGIQHYKYISTWHQSQEEYEKSKQRDAEKTEYCIKNNIPLIRIPYYDLDKISIEYINNKYKEVIQSEVL